MFVFQFLPIIMVTVGDCGQQDDESDGKMAQEMLSVSWAAGKCFFLVSFLFFLLTMFFMYYWLTFLQMMKTVKNNQCNQ